MRSIFIIGAGRSSSYLIKYLLDHSKEQQWSLTIGDVSLESAQKKTGNHPNGRAIAFDIHDEKQRSEEIKKADLVISLLPAHMHLSVAVECVKQKKHLVTASYITKEMQELHVDALKSGVTLLNECGLDPGIDHMSAMNIIDEIKSGGGEIVSFKSYTGGLVAPESNDNPWGYKFSWNPRNVILAGQGTAKHIKDGKYKYIPYSRLFSEIETIEVDGSSYDGYANRDSLAYRKIYQLGSIPTMLRGTLRQEGFCNAWNVFVQLGLTDDSYTIEDSIHLTYAQLVEAFLPKSLKYGSMKSRVALFMGLNEKSIEMNMIDWTGIFDNVPINIDKATPAQILQNLLEKKWRLKEEDKDMIVMQHRFTIYDSPIRKIISSLVVKGEDSGYTAMAKTVGLPAAIASKLILNGNIKARGVLVPVTKEIYEPVLDELEKLGIVFKEVRN